MVELPSLLLIMDELSSPALSGAARCVSLSMGALLIYHVRSDRVERDSE